MFRREREDFLKLDAPRVFKEIEMKIMEMIPVIKNQQIQDNSESKQKRRKINEKSMKNHISKEEEMEEEYSGIDEDSKVYIYLASDNEVVKEALTTYLLNHQNISVMR